MTIFKTYTGNAMLNNALMTIEALAGLRSVAEITTDVLMKLYLQPIAGYSLIDLNQRFKSYTMIFTKNGPLHNDKEFGKKIYNELCKSIIQHFEIDGQFECEISGLKYSNDFEKIFNDVLMKVGISKEKIVKKDTTLNRCWFPLIGGLGSDAQALPQAKFALKIHPICIVIMQFLPLSALLFKGRILLIDSSNFDFSRSYVNFNLEVVKQKIQLVKGNEPIENIKDFAKGNYLMKALDLLDKKGFVEDYSDLNLWSFSNSGTGASCEIDRIPNTLIQKLIKLRSLTKISNELKKIIENREISGGFIISLGDNQQWWGLYPTKKYEGVSVPFFEAYFEIIGHEKNIEYSKYIAYLISKYKTKSFEKYLSKSDADSEENYKSDLYSVLLKATEEGFWNLNHHLQILDSQELPIRNSSYALFKTIHFFYQKQSFIETISEPESIASNASNFIKWIISLIQNDINSKTMIKRLMDRQEYINVGFNEMFLRSASNSSVSISNIFESVYNSDGSTNRYGLNELLHLFFRQLIKEKYDDLDLQITLNRIKTDFTNWYESFEKFSQSYQTYYFAKYVNSETGEKPFNKYLNQITSIPNDTAHFLRWIDEAIANTNIFLNDNNELEQEQLSDTILFNPHGEFSVGFARFAIQLLLRKTYFLTINHDKF
jgi:hypothetical protein